MHSPSMDPVGASSLGQVLPASPPQKVLRLTRGVRIPDELKLARFERNPELGPRILFLSGGSALRPVSQRLIHYTHNSIHLITPFDSGGSSAELRKAFDMPAVGDVRNRLMALADRTLQGNPQVFRLFAHRLPRTAAAAALREELAALAAGSHHLVNHVPEPLRRIICHQIHRLAERLPVDFDLRGASIGNLVLAAGYLDHDYHLEPVIYVYSRLVQVRGIVRATTDACLHLAADLGDGRRIVGQHLFGDVLGADDAPRVTRFELADTEGEARTCQITPEVAGLIAKADLICYPMGSFFTSILANLLPAGIAEAIALNPCPKVFIPSTGSDPESNRLSADDQVAWLLRLLEIGGGRTRVTPEDLLNLVVVDRRPDSYPAGRAIEAMRDRGLQVIEYPLVTKTGIPRIYEGRLLPLLLSLC